MILVLLLVLVVIVALADWGLTWLVWWRSRIDCLPIRSTLANLVQPRRIVGIAGLAVANLAAAARLNLPFAEVVDMAGREEGGEAKAALTRLSYWLARGSMPSVALRHSIRGCPAFVSATVQVGEDSGQITAALELANARIRQRRNQSASLLTTGWIYPCVLFLFWVAIVAGTLLVVVPKFKEIFCDFGTPLPASTVALIDLGAGASGLAGPLLCVVAAVIPLGLLVAGLSLRPRRPGSPRVLSSIGDSFRWILPFFRSFDRGTGHAAVLDAIRMGLQGGLPLERAVRLACDVDVNCQVRNQYRDFGRNLIAGIDPGDAATGAGLGCVVAAAFNSVMRGTSPNVALQYAADYHRAMANRRWHVLARLLTPLVTLAAGCLIALTALALFQPLIALIDSLVRSMGG